MKVRHRNNKYGAVKVKTSEGVFDSQKEYTRYKELQMLQKAGVISDLQKQVTYVLIPKQNKEQAVKYIADFVYIENGKTVVEDTKSEITRKNPTYVIKRKLMLWVHDIHIKEV